MELPHTSISHPYLIPKAPSTFCPLQTIGNFKLNSVIKKVLQKNQDSDVSSAMSF